MNTITLRELAALGVAAAVVGCASTPEADGGKLAPEKKADGPAMATISGDPNPFANYSDGMASDPNRPMAVEWHNQVADRLAKETSVEALKECVRLPKSADDLLAQVKPAYETDPMVATKIAAVSQIVMCRKWDKAPAAREIWTCALLGAAEKATDDYRRMFFLDQLRWCGKSAQADRVLQIGRKSGSKAVNDFAMIVATEIMK